MRTLIAICALALAGGCAATDTADTRLAAADCKVYPVTTASAAGVRAPKVSAIEQRDAQFQLAASSYRMGLLRQNGYFMNNVEDALRDCAAR
ncbi:MAG TPA: hypothetical protein VLC53_13260 [Myxococcota bacterium]|nr:hypothetical protein [Myxococcota bacterium]